MNGREGCYIWFVRRLERIDRFIIEVKKKDTWTVPAHVDEHDLESRGDQIVIKSYGPDGAEWGECYLIPLNVMLIEGDAAFDAALREWWEKEQEERKREKQEKRDAEAAEREAKERKEYTRLTKKFNNDFCVSLDDNRDWKGEEQ